VTSESPESVATPCCLEAEFGCHVLALCLNLISSWLAPFKKFATTLKERMAGLVRDMREATSSPFEELPIINVAR